jgi:hypothetical protein
LFETNPRALATVPFTDRPDVFALRPHTPALAPCSLAIAIAATLDGLDDDVPAHVPKIGCAEKREKRSFEIVMT